MIEDRQDLKAHPTVKKSSMIEDRQDLKAHPTVKQ